MRASAAFRERKGNIRAPPYRQAGGRAELGARLQAWGCHSNFTLYYKQNYSYPVSSKCCPARPLT